MAALPVNDRVHNDHVDFFLKEENIFVNEYSNEFAKIVKWDKGLRAFLSSRREPVLLKLSQMYRQLKDGTQGLDDTISHVTGLIKHHTAQFEFTNKTEMFRTRVNDDPNNLPTLTSTAQSDTSVIQLAALTSYLYRSASDEKVLVEKLEDILHNLKALREPVVLDGVFKMIQLYDERETACASVLKDYENVIQFNNRKRHDFKALTVLAKDRQDVFQIRQKYVKSVIKLWRLHMKICRITNDRVSVLLKTNEQRKNFMSRYLTELTQAMLDYNVAVLTKLQICQAQQHYAPMQSHIFNTRTGFYVSEEPPVEPVILKPHQITTISDNTSIYTEAKLAPSSPKSSLKLDKYGHPQAPTAPEIPEDYEASPFNDCDLQNCEENAASNNNHYQNPYEEVDTTGPQRDDIVGEIESPNVAHNDMDVPPVPARTHNDSSTYGGVPDGSILLAPPDPFPVRYNASIKPKPVPNSVKGYFKNVEFTSSVDRLIQRSRGFAPPGPFPEDKTTVLVTRGFIRGTFSSKEVTLIYTKSHNIFVLLDKPPSDATKKKAKRAERPGQDPTPAEIIEAEDDDCDYDQYIKTWGPDDIPPFDGMITIARHSRKDQLRLCLKEHNPSAFSRNRELKVYFDDQNKVTAWMGFVNTHNRTGIDEHESKVEPNFHDL